VEARGRKQQKEAEEEKGKKIHGDTLGACVIIIFSSPLPH